MSVLRFIGNVIWFVFGGLFMGLAWYFIGLIAFVSIIGIPFGRACFTIGSFHFAPFGYQAVSRRMVNGHDDIGTSVLGMVGNVIWCLLFGWGLALGHTASAVGCFVTVIGIPFGIQHLKLALIAFFPIGMTIVPAD